MINRFEQSSSWSERRLIFEVSPEQPQKKVPPMEGSETDNEGTKEQEEAKQDRKKVKVETQKKRRELSEDVERQGRRAIEKKIGAEKKNEPDTPQQKPSQKNPVPPPEKKKEFMDMLAAGVDKFVKFLKTMGNKLALLFAPLVKVLRKIRIPGFSGIQENVAIFDALVSKEKAALFIELRASGIDVTLNDADPEKDDQAIEAIIAIGNKVSAGDAVKLEQFFAAVSAKYLEKNGKELRDFSDLIPVAEEVRKSQPVEAPKNEVQGNINLKSGDVEKIQFPDKISFNEFKNGANIGPYTVKIGPPNSIQVGDKHWKLEGKEGDAKGAQMEIMNAEWSNNQLLFEIKGTKFFIFSKTEDNLLPEAEAVRLIKHLATSSEDYKILDANGKYIGTDIVPVT